MLQRGRARASAEGTWHVPVRNDTLQLQRGRARASAEGCERVVITAQSWDALQRGRARASAEGQPLTRSQHCRLLRFNGAALVRARKGDRCHDGPGAVVRFNGAALVRARKETANVSHFDANYSCFNGAALVRARKGNLASETWFGWVASTGPRSCERGRLATVVAAIGLTQLQRGRARASAEGLYSTAALPPNGSLQRGRARASAEGHEVQ